MLAPIRVKNRKRQTRQVGKRWKDIKNMTLFQTRSTGVDSLKRKIAPLDILVASYNSKFQKRRFSAFLVYDKRDAVPEFSSRTKSILLRITLGRFHMKTKIAVLALAL